jgi:hypothetical protein
VVADFSNHMPKQTVADMTFDKFSGQEFTKQTCEPLALEPKGHVPVNENGRLIS